MSDLNATRNTWIAFGTLSLAIVGGMYNLTIAPIDNRVEYLSQQIDTLQVAVGAMQQDQGKTATHIEYIKQALERIEDRQGDGE